MSKLTQDPNVKRKLRKLSSDLKVFISLLAKEESARIKKEIDKLRDSNVSN